MPPSHKTQQNVNDVQSITQHKSHSSTTDRRRSLMQLTLMYYKQHQHEQVHHKSLYYVQIGQRASGELRSCLSVAIVSNSADN